MEWDVHAYWDAVLRQDAIAMRAYFSPDAYVNWHNTNEHFTADEFIRANCEYPGDWAGQVQRVVQQGTECIAVTHVYSNTLSFHVVSFIRLEGGLIASIDEYWGDDGAAPAWRLDMHIGGPIE